MAARELLTHFPFALAVFYESGQFAGDAVGVKKEPSGGVWCD